LPSRPRRPALRTTALPTGAVIAFDDIHKLPGRVAWFATADGVCCDLNLFSESANDAGGAGFSKAGFGNGLGKFPTCSVSRKGCVIVVDCSG